MMKRIWLLPIAVVAVWQGPARLVRWMMDRPAQACDRGCPLAGHDRRDHEATAELDRTQALRPGATCDLDNISGDIEVRPAAGGIAHLHATLTARDRSPDAARQALQHVRVEWHGDERGLSARAVYDPGLPRSADVDVSYTLELPAGASLRVRTVSGDVDVSGATAGAEVRSASGDLNLSGIARGARLETASGDVHLEDVAGPLHITTASGDIDGRLGRGFTGGQIQTASGDVSLQAARGAALGVRAATASGDVSSDFPASGAVPLDIHTASGDISVAAD